MRSKKYDWLSSEIAEISSKKVDIESHQKEVEKFKLSLMTKVRKSRKNRKSKNF